MSMELSITLPPGGFIIRDLFLSGLYVIAREGSAIDLIMNGNTVTMRFPSHYAFVYGFKRAIDAFIKNCFGQGNKHRNINLKDVLEIFSNNKNYGPLINNIFYHCYYLPNPQGSISTKPADYTTFSNCMHQNVTRFTNDLENLSRVCKDPYSLIIGSCGSDGRLPLLFPEVMESTRWFGGWNGNKNKLMKLDTAPIVSLVSLIGLCHFSIVGTIDMWLVAPIDSVVGSISLLSQVVREPMASARGMDGEVVNRLSQAGRFFVTSLLIRGSRLQKVLNLMIIKKEPKKSSKSGKKLGLRVEVVEDVPASFLARFVNFSTSLNGGTVNKLLRLISNEYVDELRNELSRGGGFRDREQARKQAEADVGYVMNVISKAVMDSLNGHITPEEAVYLIARESFMRVPKYAEVLDSKVLRDIKDALDIQLLMGG